MKWSESNRAISVAGSVFLAFFFISLSPLPAALSQEKPPAWEVYFSPHGGCTDAIIREVTKAKSTLLIQAYSFTSAPIAKAVVNARRRGVKVQVILDKSQRTDKYSSATFPRQSF